MKKFFSVLMLFIMVAGFMINTAEAARFGGGRSFGAQRSFSGFSRMQPPQRAISQTPRPNRWLAPLAGLAMGGLLAYLFMGHGVGISILSWLAIFSVGLLIVSFLRRKFQMSAAQNNQFRGNNVFDMQSHFQSQQAYTPGNNTFSQPTVVFEQQAFLRDAKVKFIRLQAAFDAGDLNDLREFTSPEVFAEIKLQLQERGQEKNYTEVVSLDAELVDMAAGKQSTVVSVQFSGTIREALNAPAEAFNEVWHFQTNNRLENGIVIGVQQN